MAVPGFSLIVTVSPQNARARSAHNASRPYLLSVTRLPIAASRITAPHTAVADPQTTGYAGDNPLAEQGGVRHGLARSADRQRAENRTATHCPSGIPES